MLDGSNTRIVGNVCWYIAAYSSGLKMYRSSYSMPNSCNNSVYSSNNMLGYRHVAPMGQGGLRQYLRQIQLWNFLCCVAATCR